MIVRPPRPASKAVTCVRKIIDTSNGIDDSRYGSGFFYRDERDQIWLVSNWHVFTSRRPDDAGYLLNGACQSPRAIVVGLKEAGTSNFKVEEFDLYDGDQPRWRQHPDGPSQDIAALPITVPPEREITCIQDAAQDLAGPIEPGFDLIIIGFPFVAGNDVPYPLWKRALLASEPSVQWFGASQMLIDTPGTPGMSGAPIFVAHQGYHLTPEQAAAQARINSGISSIFDDQNYFDWLDRANQTVGLEFIGIYAGATGDDNLEKLRLGRMYSASNVAMTVQNGVPGANPFPPAKY